MDGKKRFFLFLFFSFFFCDDTYTSISLSIASGDTYEAVLGEVCTIDLMIKNIPKGFKDPIIHISDGVQLQRTGLHMTSINGVSSTRFSYQAHFDEIGTFVVGPAELTHNGVSYTSNTITITVTHGTPDINSKRKDIFLTLSTDTAHAVVGQKIHCMLTCYVKKNGITIEQIVPSRIKDMELQNLKGPIKGEERIDGQLYPTLSLSWDIVPLKAGELVLPAALLEYSQAKQASFFFNMFAKVDRIYSNASIVQVFDLPEVHQGRCDGVGVFTDFLATVHPSFIKVGDAATISLTLSGEGTLLEKDGYMLQAIPSHIRYYPVATKYEEKKYVFEYVLQSIHEGIYIFPEQYFTYFDITKKKYETLKTTALELHIIANSVLQENTQLVKKEVMKEEISEIPVNQQLSLGFDLPSHDEFIKETKNRYREMNFYYFFLLVLLLCIPYLMIIITSQSMVFQLFLHRVAFYFVVLYAQLHMYRIIQHGDVREAYTLILSIIAQHFSCSNEEVYRHSEDIAKKIEKIKGERHSWDIFFQRVMSILYAQTRLKKKERQLLCKEASIWLSMLRSL